MMSKYLNTFIKVGISFSLLGLIFLFISPRKIIKNFWKINVWYYAIGALGIQIVLVVVQGLSWRALFRSFTRLTIYQATIGHLMVNFAGTLMPGRFSSRLAAPFIFIRMSDKLEFSKSTAVTYVHTVLFLLAFGSASGIGFVLMMILEGNQFISTFLLPIGLFLGVGLLGLAFPFLNTSESTRNLPIVSRCVDFILSFKTIGSLASFLRSNIALIQRIFKEYSSVTKASVFLFISITVCSGFRIGGLFMAYGLSPQILTFIFIVPTAYSVNIIPASFGGIGLAEASAISVFVLLGYDPDLVATIVFVDRFLAAYLPAFFGWAFFSWYGLDTSSLSGSPNNE